MVDNVTVAQEDLLNCPFCQRADELECLHKGAADEWWWHVFCDTCCATGPSEPTKAEAIAAWNTRLSPAPEGVDAREAFQVRVDDWLLACFGAGIARDPIERNHRFLEESLELVQACGCTASEAHQLVDYTFGRPVGERGQEVGGVMNTLAALCLAYDMDMAAEGDREIERCWIKIDRIREKQRNKPKHSPLPAALSRPPAEQVRMREALEKCRETFDRYVSLHMAKQPPDMDKAAANQEMVELCEAALTPPPKGQDDHG